MYLDVVEIRDFYSGALGQEVRWHIGNQILRHWPSHQGLQFAGIGYASPFLRPFLEKGVAVTSLFPAGQGAVIWPREGARRAVLIDEGLFPFRDASFDRVIEVHGLEFFADAESHLNEVWRVMAPEGRLLLVVPNRSGLWARLDTTPFGHGQPFSRGQLQDLLVRSRFRPLSITPLIHFAPFQLPLKVTAHPIFERMGAWVWPRFSGLLMVEAIKEVAQPIRPKRVMAPAFKTVPAHVRPQPV